MDSEEEKVEVIEAIRRRMRVLPNTRKRGDSASEQEYAVLGQKLVRLRAMTQLRRRYRTW